MSPTYCMACCTGLHIVELTYPLLKPWGKAGIQPRMQHVLSNNWFCLECSTARTNSAMGGLPSRSSSNLRQSSSHQGWCSVFSIDQFAPIPSIFHEMRILSDRSSSVSWKYGIYTVSLDLPFRSRQSWENLRWIWGSQFPQFQNLYADYPKVSLIIQFTCNAVIKKILNHPQWLL
jgi:hypothetical protein